MRSMTSHPPRHTLFEDIQGLLTGTLFVALGVYFIKSAGLLTGGAVGMAFLIYYATDWNYGLLLFLINAPFYYFGYRALGLAYTVKTFACVTLLSVYIELLPGVLKLDVIHPMFAAVMGGLLIGMGILMLIRHEASLGGVTVMVIYLQKTRQWRAGWVQMAIDVLILIGGLWMLSPDQIGLSILGAIALNLVIAVNHRKGRYFNA